MLCVGAFFGFLGICGAACGTVGFCNVFVKFLQGAATSGFGETLYIVSRETFCPICSG